MWNTSSAFITGSGASMINENPANHLSSHSKEVRAVLPGHFFLINQPDVSFVCEGRGLEDWIATFPPQMPSGELPQLIINKRSQSLQCVRISFTPVPEKLSHFLRDFHK